MSIRRRINSLLKSSISINTIRDSVVKFNDGLTKANTTSGQIVQQTNERNNFKRSLIGKDNEFFRRRRENVNRKAREDELEAASVQGVAARQGTVSSRSTKGFLGRIIDFFGIVLIGWFVTQLPKILKGIQSLIKRISKAVNILTGFVSGIQDFITNFGIGIGNLKGQMFNLDFGQQRVEAQENIEKMEGGINRLNRELFNTAKLASDPANVGLRSFDEGEIISENSVEQERPTEEKNSTDVSDLENTNSVKDFQPVKETKQKEVEADENNIEGMENDVEIQQIEAQSKQSKGATIDQKNEEIKEEKEEQDNDVSLKQRLEGFISNMFGTKSKRKKDQEEGTIEGTTKIEEIASQFQGDSQKLEAAMGKFADNMKNKKGKEGDSLIAPLRIKRDNLVEDNVVDGNTVYLIETPVGGGNNNSMSMPSGGGNKMQLNTNNPDNTNIFKKIQKIILS